MNMLKILQVALNEVGYLEKASMSQLDDKTANAGNANITKYARDLDAIGFFNGRKQQKHLTIALPGAGMP